MITTAPVLLPLTLAERAIMPDVLRVEATFEDYLEFANQCEYNVEYVNGEILSMSQASLPHESLVIRFGYLLTSLFDDQDDLSIFASSIKIHVAATGDSFNADVSIIRGEPDYLRLPSGQRSTVEITNPILVVEILSKSTQAFDLSDKLEAYKQIPSLEQVLFVSQEQPWVSSFVRSETPGVWLNTSAHTLTDSIGVLTHNVTLAEIYKKIRFS